MVGTVCQTITIANSNVISMRYMQKMHLYSSKQATFCISNVISAGYSPMPGLKPNLR